MHPLPPCDNCRTKKRVRNSGVSHLPQPQNPLVLSRYVDANVRSVQMKDDGKRKNHGGFSCGRRGIAGIALRGEEGERGHRGIKTTVGVTMSGFTADKNSNSEVHTQLEHLGKEQRRSGSSGSRRGSHLGKLIRNRFFKFKDVGTNKEATLLTR